MNKLAALLVGMTLSVAAAQDSPPAPKPPLVRVPPGGSAWSLEVKISGAEGKRAGIPERFEMRIGRNAVQQGTIKFSDGRTQTFYVVGDQVLQKHDNADDFAVLPARDGAPLDFFDFRLKGFPAVGWIALRNYVGIETIEKQECYKYQLGNTADLDLPDDVVVTAWIRVGDGFPRRVQIGDVVYEFSEVRAFSEDVALPPACQAMLENRRAEQRRLKALKSANMEEAVSPNHKAY
jgi:hypothetical protein